MLTKRQEKDENITRFLTKPKMVHDRRLGEWEPTPNLMEKNGRVRTPVIIESKKEDLLELFEIVSSMGLLCRQKKGE